MGDVRYTSQSQVGTMITRRETDGAKIKRSAAGPRGPRSG